MYQRPEFAGADNCLFAQTLNILFKYRLILGLLLVAFCVITAPYVKKALIPNNSPVIWFDKNDPVLRNYEQFQQDFGNDRVITLAFRESETILKPDVLKKIHKFSQQLAMIDGVKEISSIINAKDFRRTRENGVTRIRYSTYFDDSINFSINNTIKSELLNSPLVADRYINRKSDVALLVIRLDAFNKVEGHIKSVISEIEEAGAVYPGKKNIHLGGADVINYGLNKLSRHDFSLFSGLGFLLMFLITGLLYHRFIYLLLVTLTSVSAIFVSLAVFGMMGFRINIFSVITPPLVITLGIIGVLHIINEYENLLRNNRGKSTLLLAKKALSNIFKPAVFATLTTIIGFASLFTSPTAALKEFSVLSSAGVLFLLLFSFLFSSLLLPLQKKASTLRKKDAGFWTGVFSEHIIKRSLPYILFSIAIIILSIAGINRINNDMNVIDYFPKNDRVIVDHEFMLKNWGEYYPVELTIEAKDTSGFRNRTLIQALIDFDKELRLNPLVNSHIDFTVLMERYARVTFKKELTQILDDPLLASTFIEGFLSQLTEKSQGLITPDLLKARVIFTGPVISIREMEKNFAGINEVAKKHFHGVGTMTVSGYPSLFIKVMNYAFDSMKSSLYTSFFLVFLSLVLMLKSIRTAIIALVPNVFPVILLLGFLGFSQINLDLATCTATAIVMGIAIDDTIYFLNKYQETRKVKNTLDSIRATHQSVGKVILVSSVVMIAGFGIMLLASIKTVIYFGLLAIVSVIAAIIGDLVILPLLLKYLDSKNQIKTKA